MPSPGLWPAPTTIATLSFKRMSVHSRDRELLGYRFVIWLVVDLHMVGEFILRILHPAGREDRELGQARVELALETDMAADAVEGARHLRRVDQELVQIGVALEHVAIFGRDLVDLEVGQEGHP